MITADYNNNPSPTSRAMQITYALSQRDVFESTIAIRNRKTWAKWGCRVILAFLLSLIIRSTLTSPLSQLMSNVAPLLFLLLLWAFFLWASPWWFARTQFLKRPSSRGQQTISLDRNGVKWQWDGGLSVTEWR